MGTLYYGDRRSRIPFLDILRRYIAAESVDLAMMASRRVELRLFNENSFVFMHL